MKNRKYSVQHEETINYLNELLEDAKTYYVKYQDHLAALPHEHDIRNADRRLAIARDAKESFLKSHSLVLGAMLAMEFVINNHRDKDIGCFQIVNADDYVNARVIFEEPSEDDLPF